MTPSEFLAFYPQFSSSPAVVLESFIPHANRRFLCLEGSEAGEAPPLYF